MHSAAASPVSNLFEEFARLTAHSESNSNSNSNSQSNQAKSTASSMSASTLRPASSSSASLYSSLSTSPVALVHALNVRRSSIQSTRRATAPLQLIQQEREKAKMHQQPPQPAGGGIVELIEGRIDSIKRLHGFRRSSVESQASSEEDERGLQTPLEYHSPSNKQNKDAAEVVNRVELSSAVSSLVIDQSQTDASIPNSSYYFSFPYPYHYPFAAPVFPPLAAPPLPPPSAASFSVSAFAASPSHAHLPPSYPPMIHPAPVASHASSRPPAPLSIVPPISPTVHATIHPSPSPSHSKSVSGSVTPESCSSPVDAPSITDPASSASLRLSAVLSELEVTKLDNELLMATLRDVQAEKEKLLKTIENRQNNQTKQTKAGKAKQSKRNEETRKPKAAGEKKHQAGRTQTSRLTRIVARVQDKRLNHHQHQHQTIDSRVEAAIPQRILSSGTLTESVSLSEPQCDPSPIPIVSIRLDELRL